MLPKEHERPWAGVHTGEALKQSLAGVEGGLTWQGVSYFLNILPLTGSFMSC